MGQLLERVSDAQDSGLTVWRPEDLQLEIPDLDDFMASTALYLTHSRHDLDRFLAERPGDVRRQGITGRRR